MANGVAYARVGTCGLDWAARLSLPTWDPEDRDRAPADGRRLAVGLAVSVLAGIAGWIVIVAPAAILTGDGGKGLAALGDVALSMSDRARPERYRSPWLRLMVTAASDALFLLVFVAVAAAVAGHDLKRYFTAAPRFRWRLLGFWAGRWPWWRLTPAVMADRAARRRHRRSADSWPSRSGWGGRDVLRRRQSAPGSGGHGGGTGVPRPGCCASSPPCRGGRRCSWSGSGLVFSAIHFDFSPDGFITRAVMGARPGLHDPARWAGSNWRRVSTRRTTS